MRRQSARVCGKSCGKVPRNDRVFVLFAFILSLFLWTGCIHRKVEVTKRTYTAEELRKVIIGYVGDDEVSVDNKQDSTQRNYGVLKKVR